MFFVFEIFLFSKKRYCYLVQILKHKKLKLVLIKRTQTSNFLSPQLFLQSSYSLPVGFQQINNLCLSKAPGPVHSHPERVAQVFLSDFSLKRRVQTAHHARRQLTPHFCIHFCTVINAVIAGSATSHFKVHEQV